MLRNNFERLLDMDRRSVLKGIGASGLGAAITGGAASATSQQETPTPGPDDDPDDEVDKHGPYRNHRFLVEIDGIAISGFSRAVLPQAANDNMAYREGTDPPANRKLAGATQHDSLILEKGVTDDSIALYEWFKSVEQGKVDEARRAIAVIILDLEGNPGPRWEFKQAWPKRYDAPDLDAHRGRVSAFSVPSERIAIERLEILHEGMERVA